jgi:predicted RND superfamily exporter protein
VFFGSCGLKANMWAALTRSILRNRFVYLGGVFLLTAFFGWRASKIELSYNFAKILPPKDPEYASYDKFKKLFGEDGNVMVIGIQSPEVFKEKVFNPWAQLTHRINRIPGIKEVLSISNAYEVKFNDSLEKFSISTLNKKTTLNQTEIDSLRKKISELPLYEGLIFNSADNSTRLAITFNDKALNSKDRLMIVDSIDYYANKFTKATNVEPHFSGLPYIRSAMMKKVSGEMKLFLLLAVLVTAIILWIFFRSIPVTLYSLLIVLIGVVWVFGTIQLCGYKLTILSVLIPPLIIVIGIPNCVFFINRYHSEFARYKNKVKALGRMIESMGPTLFLANVTTAIGFAVLYFTSSELLVEFGIVASINVMLTYLITLVLVPIILSFLGTPDNKQVRHLEAKRIRKVIALVDHFSQNKRKEVYIVTGVITAICIFGMTKINVIGYVVDDIPEKDKAYTDLKFFEKHFKGVLPFEIVIDTKKRNGVFADNAKVIYKIRALERIMAEYPVFTKPISVNEGIKSVYQAYRGGAPKFFRIPGIDDLGKLVDYKDAVKGKENRFTSYIDTAKQITRVSYYMADIGSRESKILMAKLQPRIDSLFRDTKAEVSFTGHSLVFLKSNDYLLSNLFESFIIEIVLITLVGLALFRSIRIILLSKLPCLIPLVITAGVMGFMDIRFKPSTILIFSIAFGIASDGTIYFLTRYRQELKKNKTSSIAKAISVCVNDIGISMIYTAIILFCGFSIFIASDFGGTVALGVLISLTLLVSMCTNLILLPSILISLSNSITKKDIVES